MCGRQLGDCRCGQLYVQLTAGLGKTPLDAIGLRMQDLQGFQADSWTALDHLGLGGHGHSLRHRYKFNLKRHRRLVMAALFRGKWLGRGTAGQNLSRRIHRFHGDVVKMGSAVRARTFVPERPVGQRCLPLVSDCPAAMVVR